MLIIYVVGIGVVRHLAKDSPNKTVPAFNCFLMSPCRGPSILNDALQNLDQHFKGYFIANKLTFDRHGHNRLISFILEYVHTIAIVT